MDRFYNGMRQYCIIAVSHFQNRHLVVFVEPTEIMISDTHSSRVMKALNVRRYSSPGIHSLIIPIIYQQLQQPTVGRAHKHPMHVSLAYVSYHLESAR